jgi:hypothetical protein
MTGRFGIRENLEVGLEKLDQPLEVLADLAFNRDREGPESEGNGCPHFAGQL